MMLSHFTLTTMQLNRSFLKNFKLFQNDSETITIFLQDDQVTNSEDTFALTQKEMKRTLDTLIFLTILSTIWLFRAYPYLQAIRKAAKLQKKRNCTSNRQSYSPRYQRAVLIQLIYSCFLVTLFPPIAQLHFLHKNTHMTHNSSNRSHEGLMLETSAFKLFTVANLHHQLI